jgi:hypothetical protein
MSTADHQVVPVPAAELRALRESHAELLALLMEWSNTEMDAYDEDWQPWMDQYTARVKTAIAKAQS